MLHIVAFIGSQGSGKTTTATELIKHKPVLKELVPDAEIATRISFADALRREVAERFATPDMDMYMIMDAMSDPSTKQLWRPLLQAWGQLRRDFDPEYWIKKWLQRVNQLSHEYTPHDLLVVVDDCRYENEYTVLRNLDAWMVGLDPDPAKLPVTDSHESEQEWPFFIVDFDLPWMSVERRINILVGEILRLRRRK